MGLGAIDYALHCDRRPSLLVVTDIDDERLARAESIYTVEHAKGLASGCARQHREARLRHEVSA